MVVPSRYPPRFESMIYRAQAVPYCCLCPLTARRSSCPLRPHKIWRFFTRLVLFAAATVGSCVLLEPDSNVAVVVDSHIQRIVVLVLCVFSSHPFWTSSSLDVPAGVTQEEGHTGFLIHLPSAVRALIFVARRIQPFLSLVDREVEFCVLTN